MEPHNVVDIFAINVLIALPCNDYIIVKICSSSFWKISKMFEFNFDKPTITGVGRQRFQIDWPIIHLGI